MERDGNARRRGGQGGGRMRRAHGKERSDDHDRDNKRIAWMYSREEFTRG